ncbi:MAG: penicillin-binding transpeptidase domain-containing protein, partial [Myxococcota bacterium]|nr:penicillin-binding transpeptidase domain-containing protein [Myxococcota bacterium]
EPGGTGYLRRSSVVSMAGKTGTAQVVRLGSVREKSADMKYFSRDHAWFAAYAPIEAPELVVVVVNEHAGHGGAMAGPIAVKVIDAYFQLKAERSTLALGSGAASTFEGGEVP